MTEHKGNGNKLGKQPEKKNELTTVVFVNVHLLEPAGSDFPKSCNLFNFNNNETHAGFT